MIKLKNIKRTENIISCDYYPEDSKMKRTIAVDLDTGEYSVLKYSDYEYGKKTYAGKTRNKLIEMSEREELPEEYVFMWY